MEIRHQIDLEKFQNISGGLLNDSTIENLENIANSAHNWAVKIRVKSQDGAEIWDLKDTNFWSKSATKLI